MDKDYKIELDVVYAQEVCDLIAKQTDCAISFMAEKGRIVASSAHARIGDIHDVAAKIMAGEMDSCDVSATEAAQSAGMKEGRNIALDIDGHRVCNIGVGGPLERARAYAAIVHLSISAMLKAQSAETRHKRELADVLEARLDQNLNAIRSSMRILDQLCQEMEEQMRRTVTNGENVAQSTITTQHNAETVSAATTQMSASVGEITRQVGEVICAVAQTTENTERTDDQIHQLEKAAEQIGQFIQVITGISSQTHMLALNATIEAARAGQQGKGFAVVAGEVKKLSSQTNKATQEISAQVKHIQSLTGQTVKDIAQISTSVGSINAIVESVSNSTTQQDQATQEIAQNSTQAAAAAAQISSDISNVIDLAQATEERVQTVTQTMQTLRQNTRQLSEDMKKVITDLRA